MVRPNMAAIWHCHVVDGQVDPIFEAVRGAYSGAAPLCQDLTVFNVSPGGVSARQATIDPVQQAVVGPSTTAETIGEPLATPTWWAAAAIDWQSKLA